MSRYKFDLIIPTYRPDGGFRELLSRIERQSLMPQRLIIVNTDVHAWELSGMQDTIESGSLAAITEIYHVSKSEFRHGATRNKAAAWGDSPLMVFMTQDAIPADNVLFERLLAPIGETAAQADHARALDCEGDSSRGIEAAGNAAGTEDGIEAAGNAAGTATDTGIGGNAAGTATDTVTGGNAGECRIAMTYARQLAGKRAGQIESITRDFNYPAESVTKTAADKDRLGIKTYFASDVCAGYDRSTFEKLGGFEPDVIFDEDMLYAARLIDAGYAVRYCADARVYHAHDYTPMQQLRRNFDNGATQAMYPEVFAGISNESEGIRLVRETARELIRRGRGWLIPELVVQSAFKYAGFRLGRAYRMLPGSLTERLSTNKEYWNR